MSEGESWFETGMAGTIINSVDVNLVRGVKLVVFIFFFFQAEDGIRDYKVTGVQTCALPIFAVVEVAAVRRERRLAGVLLLGPLLGELQSLTTRPVIDPHLARAEGALGGERSEERRVGKEGRSRGSPDHLKKKKKKKRDRYE